MHGMIGSIADATGPVAHTHCPSTGAVAFGSALTAPTKSDLARMRPGCSVTFLSGSHHSISKTNRNANRGQQNGKRNTYCTSETVGISKRKNNWIVVEEPPVC